MTTKDRIFELIEKSGTEQKKMAQYLGINPTSITDWKNGKTKSYMKCLDQIAEYFGVSTDYLLGKEPTHTATDDELKFALFNGTDGITDEMFAEVKQFAEMVKLRENAKRKGIE